MKLIDSIEKLNPEFPNIQYIIAGSGPELKNLKKISFGKKFRKEYYFCWKSK